MTRENYTGAGPFLDAVARDQRVGESFANAPISVSEARAERDQRGDLWTPRDLLIHLLRGIDDGTINMKSVVVCYREPKDGGTKTSYRYSGPDNATALGMMARVSYLINSDA